MKKLLLFSLALLLGAISLNSRAVDGFSLMAGRAGEGDAADILQAGLQWNWQKKWFTEGEWFVGGYWDATLGVLSGDSNTGGNNDLVNIGITPVFRLQQKNPTGVAPYLEGGIGFHLFSEKRIHNTKTFGTTYEFGTLLGAGLRFGKNRQFDLGYRFQHYSNAGFEKPNPGINFNQIRFGYHF